VPADGLLRGDLRHGIPRDRHCMMSAASLGWTAPTSLQLPPLLQHLLRPTQSPTHRYARCACMLAPGVPAEVLAMIKTCICYS